VQKGCGRCEWCLRGKKRTVPERNFHRHWPARQSRRIYARLRGRDHADPRRPEL
jgi:hypothetical protein